MKCKALHLAMLLSCSTLASSACLSSGVAPMGKDAMSGSEKLGSGSVAAPMADVTGFEARASGVQIQVITTGCTDVKDFEPVIHRLDDRQVQLTVLRIKPDDCRRMPASKTVEFSRETLGLEDEEIILMNPLMALPGRG